MAEENVERTTTLGVECDQDWQKRRIFVIHYDDGTARAEIFFTDINDKTQMLWITPKEAEQIHNLFQKKS